LTDSSKSEIVPQIVRNTTPTLTNNTTTTREQQNYNNKIITTTTGGPEEKIISSQKSSKVLTLSGGGNQNHHPTTQLVTTEVIFDKKRHLIGEEFFRHPVPNSENNKTVDHISAAEDLTRIPTIVSPTDENGTLIYEEAASDNSNVAFDGQQSANNQLNSSANLSNNTVQQHQQPGSKIAIQDPEIPLTSEDLLKLGEHHHEASDSIVTSDAQVLIYNSSDGAVSSSPIIDASKLGLYGSAVADFAQSQSVTTYMASILSQNEPEDLTGNRRGSNHHEENNDGLHLASLKLSDKAGHGHPVVVTTSEGPVVLTAADLTNAAFQTSVANQENGPPFTNSGDFATFDAPRPINYPPGDQYRPVGELYCAPPGDYPQRMTNSDGQFVPYQYKVEPCSTPVPNANHINSPDSGIGDPTLNASHQPESFDTYPHADILNDIGGPRKPWHQDYGRPNEEKIVVPKLPDSPYGFKYILETPTSSSARREDDRITYVNKGQFYGIGLEYAMDPEGPHIKNHTVKTVIMVLFRDGKSEDEEQKCWQFWHSRQHSVKQRILDADTKNSVGITGPIEEIAHNALAFCWNPYESPAKINLAVQCLSTDFSTQKGVKGMPLHVQIDTYDDPRDPSCPVYHRAYAQIKVFCDKGAERKARDEERRANKRKMNNTGKRRLDEMYHNATDRSEFYTMADMSKPPMFFRPITDPDKAALEFGTELPSFYTAGSRGSPPDHPTMLKMNGSNGSPSPTSTPATLEVQPIQSYISTVQNIKPILTGNGTLLGQITEPLPKRARIFPPTCDRIMIYVKQETEDAFTALHVKPPTAQGLIGAIESKYKISGNSIRFLFKQNREGHKVKIDDDMITYYSNEAAFLMQVHISEQQGPHGEDVYDITFTEI